MTATPTQIGKYPITKTIGSGAMGTVFLGIDPNINRQVAIKTAQNNHKNPSDSAKRFIQEAQLLARCNHPNIVTLLDFGQQQDMAYMVMEYIDGPDLKQWLKSHQNLPLKTIIKLFIQLLKALHYAHNNGIIHRDLKPENVLVKAPHNLKLTDFGIAKGNEQGNMTQLGITMGTPQYMAPEQMFGSDELGPHTDVYALFVMLYQMFAQLKSPEQYDAMPLAQLEQLAKHNQFNPDVLIPCALHDFMYQGLNPAVTDRFPNMQAVGKALKEALAAIQKQTNQEAQKTDSTSGFFTTGTVITQNEDAWRIEDQVFNGMRTDLADLIGPMADFILTKALKNSQSHDHLVKQIVTQLDQSAHKEAFMDRWRN